MPSFIRVSIIGIVKILFMICIPYTSLFAEDKTDRNTNYWATLGIGGSYFGVTTKACISLDYKQNCFSIRYLSSEEFQFSAGESVNSPNPYRKMREIGILYGRYYRSKFILYSLSAGLALVNGIERGKMLDRDLYETVKISGIGVPIEGNIQIEFSSFIGIGASFFTNLNSTKNNTGILFNIQFGSLPY